MTDSTEATIQAKGLTAARITPYDIDHEIVDEHYFTAAEGILAALSHTVPPGTTVTCSEAYEHVTLCVLMTRNGTKIVGVNTGPVSTANFDRDLGRELARRDAVRQLYPMLGYELRTRLQAGAVAHG